MSPSWMGGRRFQDNLQMKTFKILQREGFGKLPQNQRPLLRPLVNNVPEPNRLTSALLDVIFNFSFRYIHKKSINYFLKFTKLLITSVEEFKKDK